MKRVLVGVAFWLLLSAGKADELQWRPAISPARPAATLGTPTASLGQPIAAPEPTSALRPAAAFGQPIPVVRGQSPDAKLSPFGDGPDAPKAVPKAEVTESPGVKNPPAAAAPAPQTLPAYPMPAVAWPCDPPLIDPMRSAGPFAGDPGRFYASAEYLLWWTRAAPAPVLLTVGPAGTDGILGQPGVVPLFGGAPLEPTARSGARFGFGWWFGCCHDAGIDASFFFLGDRGTDFAVHDPGTFVLARPFFAPNSTTTPGVPIPGNFAEVIGDPGNSTGGAVIHTDSFLWGAELNYREKCLGNCGWRLDWLAGYRFLNLTEDLRITESFSGLPNAVQPMIRGVNGIIEDNFRTSNQFHGGQIGAIVERSMGRFVLDLRTKLAMGVSFESVDIDGGLRQFGPNFVRPTVPGGLLALNSNIGHFSKETFAVVPEVTFNIGYNVTDRLRFFVGYNFLYWSSVVRPGDQIDPVLDLRRIPLFSDPRFQTVGAIRPISGVHPAATLKDTDFWAQGINFGILYHW
jgi:Putative beta barrel porin-7 (BBP7)